MKLLTIFCAGIALGMAQPSAAENKEGVDASTMITMFTDACVKNTERPKGTGDYVALNPFLVLDNPQMLKTLVGDGPRGRAWIAHSPGAHHSFVVTLHSTAPTCAVWAESVDVAGMESVFRRVVEAVAQPGVTVTLEKEKVVNTPTGVGKALTYRVDYASRNRTYVFALEVADKTGSLRDGIPLQASVQLTTTPTVSE